MPRKVTPASVRFWAKVNKDGPMPATFRNRGPCWIWTAGANNRGYGMFHPTKATTTLAHRYAYEALRRPIPAGLVIDHLCRVRRCVNPDHLQPVSRGENTLRGLSVATFNRLKTECPAGHRYDAANTYVSPKGSRICRACARERDRQPHRNATLRRRLKRQEAA